MGKSFCYLICGDVSTYSHNANAYQKIYLVADMLKGKILIPRGCRQWLPTDFQNHESVVELQCSRFAPLLYSTATRFAHKEKSTLLLAVSNEVSLFCALLCACRAQVVMFCWDPPGVARRDESSLFSRIRCRVMDLLMAAAVFRANGLIMNLHPGFCERFGKSVRKKIWHFPNGTDIDYNRRCAEGVEHIPYRLAVNSSFSATKGCWHIAKRYVELWKKNPSVSLIWVGAGAELDAIKRYFHENGIPDCSFELGFFDHNSAIRKLATGSMALCMYENVPSLRWNYVLKAPELLSLGIPIVAPRLPGVSQYVMDGINGFLYDDEECIVDTISACFYSEKESEDFKGAALKSVEEFDWQLVNANIAKKLQSNSGICAAVK